MLVSIFILTMVIIQKLNYQQGHLVTRATKQDIRSNGYSRFIGAEV